MLRKQTRRQEAETARRERPSVDLTEALAEWLSGFERVASFVAMGNEPAIEPRVGWLLPVLRPDDDLDWARYEGRLEKGRRGLLEPVGPRLGIDSIAFAQLVLTPALLVDREGYRLGRGGGSYDRALMRATGLVVAVVHDEELVDEVPHEPHDVPVHAVVTPSGGLVQLR
jgi:5-formyltetrahydrofolate cyclo-ligase